MKHFFYLIYILLSAQLFIAQEKNSNYREGKSLNLIINDSSTYEINITNSPVIIGDSIIQIYPGEKILIEADIFKGRLRNLKTVTEIKNVDKTLVFEFKQVTEGREHKQMVLQVTNPFNKDLQYNSQLYLYKYKKWVNSSVAPVRAKKASFELWPDLISSVTISDMRFK
jgi:hypothetical protein